MSRGALRPRARRLAARALLAALLAALALELGARALLFSAVAAELPRAEDLRRPERLAHPGEDLYWTLQRAFQRAAGGTFLEVPGYDPELGWTGGLVHPAEDPVAPWVHRDAGSLGQRRAVLLYGDSYAACASPRGTCFQDWLEATPWAATHRILNHGVGGYGLDQAVLLLERSAAGHADPVVVLGILVDDDLDRCALGFRGWPKPRFERAAGGWEPRPAAATPPEPPLLASYGLRLALHSGALRATALHRALCPEGRLERENRERCRMLLERAAGWLAERDVETFAVLFFGPQSLADPARNGWREAFVVETLEELGLPWVSTRDPLLAHAAGSGRAPSDYFLPNGHLGPLGNQVALRAITEGLAGRFGAEARTDFDVAELFGAPAPDRIAEVTLGGEGSAARYEYGFRPPFGRVEADRSRLCFRATGDAPTSVRYDLGGRARGFRATARFIPVGKLGPGEGSVVLELRADGESLERVRLERGQERALAVDLTGRRALEISVDTAGDGARGDWLYLASPRFE